MFKGSYLLKTIILGIQSLVFGSVNLGNLTYPGSLTVSLPLKFYRTPKERKTSFFRGELLNFGGVTYPKNPWDVMGCQVATCLEALFGVSLGESGVSIGGVRSLRV